MSQPGLDELAALLGEIRRKTCWAVLGMSAGSMFSLHFGGRVERDHPVRNDRLTPEQRDYRGEYNLYVWSSGWSLYLGEKKICDCNDTDKPSMIQGLRQLEGQFLLRSTCKSVNEFCLIFPAGHRLFLTGWEGVEPEQLSYTLSGPHSRISVLVNGTATVCIPEKLI